MRIGNSSAGFSFVEMLVVLAIIGLLASIAAPMITNTITHSREVVLRQNLSVMRRLIDDYYADRGELPASLEVLVEEGYLRAIPVDLVHDGSADWEIKRSEDGIGIEDVHSKSDEIGSNGVPYAEW